MIIQINHGDNNIGLLNLFVMLKTNKEKVSINSYHTISIYFKWIDFFLKQIKWLPVKFCHFDFTY